MTDDEIFAIRKKLARATNAMHRVSKDATADMGDKIGEVKYASIGAVLTTVKAALQAEDLAITQPFGYVPIDGQIVMTIDTIITDTVSGGYIMFQGPGFPVKGDPQAAGGAITYFRRYALVTLFGLSVEDDDGALATRAERTPQNRTQAETEIRQLIAAMSDEDRGKFAEDFKAEFNSTLTNLPESRHGDALGFAKWWGKEEPTEEPTEEAAPDEPG